MLASALASTVVLAACSGCDNSEDTGNVKVAFGTDETAEPALGLDDVRITSTDGSFVMAVIGDTVRMHLSDSLRNKVKADVDTSVGDTSSFGMCRAPRSAFSVHRSAFIVHRSHSPPALSAAGLPDRPWPCACGTTAPPCGVCSARRSSWTTGRSGRPGAGYPRSLH